MLMLALLCNALMSRSEVERIINNGKSYIAPATSKYSKYYIDPATIQSIIDGESTLINSLDAFIATMSASDQLAELRRTRAIHQSTLKTFQDMQNVSKKR
jgi:hypothetical protein